MWYSRLRQGSKGLAPELLCISVITSRGSYIQFHGLQIDFLNNLKGQKQMDIEIEIMNRPLPDCCRPHCESSCGRS